MGGCGGAGAPATVAPVRERSERQMKNMLTAGAVALALAAPVHAQWEKFDALCGSSRDRCQVKFDGEKMTMPGLVIYAEDVVSWNMSDNTTQRCYHGWFGAKSCYNPNEDQRFFIKYMGDDGTRQLVQVAFLNHKPARSFINMMSLWSGLQSENLKTTVQAERRTAAQDPGSVQPFEDVTTSPNAKNKGAHNLGEGSVPAKRYRKASRPQPKACWSAYLEANPSMKVWADANPEAAEQVKTKKYDDC